MKDYKEIIRKYFKSWLDSDISKLEDIFAEDVIYTECYGPQYRGIENIKKWFSDWNTHGKVLKWEIKSFVEEESVTAAEWYFECRYDEKTYGFDGISLVTFNSEDRIIELKEFQSKAEHYYPYGK
ncbi:nuclear transport factor 2 family protein [uncultured Clostridium sp.]|uniref:nuclear transport factor 2 family protein n=1 Tax=uncultured Clostridium sp. TaxID=59620 RepID=UPI0025D436FA|nr:nuclear transport factor 2 family protein [uncultured Clostridium sp.]